MAKKYIILDTETTGLEVLQGHRIIEIGAVLMNDRKKSKEHFHTYLNPSRLIDEEASKVHGIMNEDLLNKPSFDEIAEEFLEYFDGFSIGSNDLTQLTLGMDRDSGLIADGFDERNNAVKSMITMAIDACHRQGKYIGICGQGPSDHMDFAQWLLEKEISSISLNPDTVVETWNKLGQL